MGFPGAVVTDGCEPFDVGVGNLGPLQELLEPLSHFSTTPLIYQIVLYIPTPCACPNPFTLLSFLPSPLHTLDVIKWLKQKF